MDSPNKKTTEENPYQGNRSTDRTLSQTVENPDDAAVLLEAYRKNEISVGSVSGSIPTATLFGWLVSSKISQREFDDLVDDQSVQEIELGKEGVSDHLGKEDHEAELIGEIRSKLAAYPEKTPVDSLDPEHVRAWSNPEEGPSGIGAILTFEKKEADEEGPAASFTVELRIPTFGRDFSDAIRAEAIFSGHAALGDGMAFSVSFPLPVMKNGRRRLFVTVVESGSKTSLRIPTEVAMAFRERCLTKIEILHSKPKSKGLLDVVSKAVGKVIGKP